MIETTVPQSHTAMTATTIDWNASLRLMTVVTATSTPSHLSVGSSLPTSTATFTSNMFSVSNGIGLAAGAGSKIGVSVAASIGTAINDLPEPIKPAANRGLLID